MTFFVLGLFFTACAGGHRTPEPAAPSSEAAIPQAPQKSLAPESQLPGISIHPTPEGNGDPYNGPHLDGLSVPPAPDSLMSSEQLESAAGLCLENLNFKLLHQAFGQHVRRFQTYTFTGVHPNQPGPEDYVASARGIVLFTLDDETKTRRLYSRVDTGISGPGAMMRSPGFRVYIEPHGERDLSDFPPEKADRTFWLELPSGLPRMLLDVPANAPVSRKGELVSHVSVRATGVMPAAIRGSAVPLIDGFTKKPTDFTINTETFAHCLQNLTQTDDGGPSPMAPGGARVTADKSVTQFRALAPEMFEDDQTNASLGTVAARSAWQQKMWDDEGKAADRIFDAYLDGHWDQRAADHWGNFCELADRGTIAERQYCVDLSHRVSEEFYRRSLERLSAWTSIPGFRELVALTPAPETFPRFRIGSRSAKVGGFFRGPGFVAANLLEVKPDNWWLFFVHELVHSIDPMLTGAARRYEHAVEALSDPTSTKPRAERIDEVVRYGLDRGLLAEWRAWVVTFYLHRAAVRRNAWPYHIGIEFLLEGAKTANDVKRKVLRYLNDRKRFVDPTTGVFADPEVRAALARYRDRLDDVKEPLPSMGVLEHILETEPPR